MTVLGEMIYQDGVEIGREEGREKGREEGEDRVNKLYSKLVAEKRSNDLEKAIQDKNFRNSLYKKYGL